MPENEAPAYQYWRGMPGLEPGDGRIKILWIEDHPDRFLPDEGESAALSKWYSIIWVEGPTALQHLLRDSSVAGAHVSADLYDAPRLPCDVLLCDFRLCDTPDTCRMQKHISVGQHAPSGGFLMGVFLTLRWPEHPQAVIPYSGYDEEYGQIWTLCKDFCAPSAVHVLWDERTTKGRRDPVLLIGLIAAQFREALIRAIACGSVHIPLAEYDRLHEIPAQQVSGVDGMRVPGEEVVWLVGAHGIRPLRLGALFHDACDRKTSTVPAEIVREWLDGIAKPGDPIEQRARNLAQCYFWLRCTPLSQAIYRIIALMKRRVAIPDVSPQPPGFDSLMLWKKAKDGRQLVRLTFLFLLVMEQAARRGGLSEKAQALLDAITKLYAGGMDVTKLTDCLVEVAKNLDADGTTTFLATVEEIAKQGCIGGVNLFSDALIEGAPDVELVEGLETEISDRIVIQLVDPLPSRWDQPLTVNTSGTLAKSMSRLWSGTESYNVMELVAGDMAHISPSELACAGRLAHELLPGQKRQWPLWLR